MTQALLLIMALAFVSPPAGNGGPAYFEASELSLDTNSDGYAVSGDVILVQGNYVATGSRATIKATAGQNPTITKLEGARLRIKKDDPALDYTAMGEDALSCGKNQYELGADELTLKDFGYEGLGLFFTMCDCGLDSAPSWWLKAKKARLVLKGDLGSNKMDNDPWGIKNRIHLYNLVPHIHPFDLFDLPIFWLPYISYPLQSRAFGLLSPRITSMFSSWPAFDLPLFIPLGRSYDVTVIPGYFPTRGPRAGLEFRYAPAQGTYGELFAQYTAHIHHPETLFTGKDNPDPRRIDFIHRYEVTWHHKSDFAKQVNMRWDIDFTGDRLYLYDFSPSRRSAPYLPSRLQLLWQSRANISLQLSGDFYQDLHAHWPAFAETTIASCQNDWRPECSPYFNWTKISQMVQRLPAVRLVLSPTSLGHLPLWVSGEFNNTTYAPWTNFSQELFGFINGRAEIGGTLQKWQFPLAFTASYNYTQTYSGHNGMAMLHFPRINIFSDTRLGRLFTYQNSNNRIIHRLNFRADYLLIPKVFQEDSPEVLWASTANNALAALAPSLIDEHLQLQPVHQFLLTAGTAIRIPPVNFTWDLKITQGFNLGAISGATAAGLGQLGIRTSFILKNWFNAYLKLSLDWQKLSLSEIDTGGRFYFGSKLFKGSYISAGYYRLRGGSDQLLATIYELIPGGGFPAALSSGEDHYLNSTINFQIKNWNIRYGIRYIFALESLTAEENAARYRGDLDRHYFTIGYKSACDCWGVSLALVMPHQFFKGNTSSQFAPSFNILLDLAGLALGL